MIQSLRPSTTGPRNGSTDPIPTTKYHRSSRYLRVATSTIRNLLHEIRLRHSCSAETAPHPTGRGTRLPMDQRCLVGKVLSEAESIPLVHHPKRYTHWGKPAKTRHYRRPKLPKMQRTRDANAPLLFMSIYEKGLGFCTFETGGDRSCGRHYEDDARQISISYLPPPNRSSKLRAPMDPLGLDQDHPLIDNHCPKIKIKLER